VDVESAPARLPSLEEVRAERARRSLAEFTRQGWSVVEPATPLIWNWHLDALAEHLEAVSKGQIRNLLINVPPGTMKSLETCVFWPAWVWTKNPAWRVNFWSYADEVSIRDSVKCRAVVRSDWYQRSFVKDAWALAPDQDTKHFFQNTRMGFRMALSIGGSTTGLRGDAIVIDDPLNAKEASSKAKRQAVLNAWDQGIGNRLNDLQTGARVVIMQRLHEEDLSGHLLRQGGWEHLCLPSEFEGKRRSVTYIRRQAASNEGGKPETAAPAPLPENAVAPPEERVKFWQDPRTREGELLFEAKFPKPVLAEERKRMGSDGYAGQHQQRPAPDEGLIFKRVWLKRWHRAGEFVPEGVESRLLPDRFDQELISIDCSFKDTDGADYVAMGVWGRLGPDKFLRDQVHARLSFAETVKKTLDLRAAYPRARAILIEDKANGPAVISVLRKRVSGIIPIEPDGGKEARAHAVSPEVEAGNVYVPLHAPWVHAYIEEMVTFPKALNDDQVDQTTQALLRFLKARSGLDALAALAK
jgi:predicted phage terminase large subunit-like protein